MEEAKKEEVKKEREIVKVSENFFVYLNDPHKLLTSVDGVTTWIRVVKKVYAEEHFTTQEQDCLNELRSLYSVAPESMDKHAIANVITKYFTPMVQYFPDANQMEPKEAKSTIPKSKEEAMQKKAQSAVRKINTDMANSGDSAMQMFDALDSEQIVEYFETTLSGEWFYSFPQDGKTVTGISFSGTVEAAKIVSAKHFMENKGGIEVLSDIMLIDLPDKYRALARATDHAIGLTMPGFAEVRKMKHVCVDKDRATGKCLRYEDKEDPYAATIAISKATRNALRHLIPEKEILAMYNEWKTKKGRNQ